MKLLGISGTITGSKTLIVIKEIIDTVKKMNNEVKTEILDLKQYNVQFCDGRSLSEYSGDTKKVIDMITSADAYIIGTPIFHGSFSGALKNLLDLVPPAKFKNKVMAFAATGGNYQHYLMVENQLKPIAGYLNAYVPPSFIFAHTEHFNVQNEIIHPGLLESIEALSEQVIHLHGKLTYSK